MAVTAADVKLWAPEFTDVDDDVIDLVLASVERRTNRTNWGIKADDGVIFFTAHLLNIRARNTASGVTGSLVDGLQIKRKKIGPIDTEYVVPSLDSGGSYSDQSLSQTSYGREYLALRALIFSARTVDT